MALLVMPHVWKCACCNVKLSQYFSFVWSLYLCRFIRNIGINKQGDRNGGDNNKTQQLEKHDKYNLWHKANVSANAICHGVNHSVLYVCYADCAVRHISLKLELTTCTKAQLKLIVYEKNDDKNTSYVDFYSGRLSLIFFWIMLTRQIEPHFFRGAYIKKKNRTQWTNTHTHSHCTGEQFPFVWDIIILAAQW